MKQRRGSGAGTAWEGARRRGTGTPDQPARLRRAALAPMAVCLLLAGCAGGGPATDRATGPGTRELVVLAAASLESAFTQIGDLMMAEQPSLTVTFSFGASSTLSQQVLAGAPADVLAVASTSSMDAVADVSRAPTVFARNTLQIAVPAGNPGGVEDLEDLADPDLAIALCAPEVPCGDAAARVLSAAGVTAAPDTYERDAKATLMKVVQGEVDAALVYRTDVRAAGAAVEGIEVPEASGIVNEYPIAVLDDAPHPADAEAFVALVLSSRGQEVLADVGFDVS